MLSGWLKMYVLAAQNTTWFTFVNSVFAQK